MGGPDSSVGIATELRAGESGDRIPVGARFSALVQTGPGAHPASCIMGTGSFLWVKGGRGVTLTPHPLLVPWSRKGRAIPLLPLWAVRPVQSLSACTRAHFNFLPLPFFMDVSTITKATKNLPSPSLTMKIGNLVLRAFFFLMNNFNFHIQFFFFYFAT